MCHIDSYNIESKFKEKLKRNRMIQCVVQDMRLARCGESKTFLTWLASYAGQNIRLQGADILKNFGLQ